MCKGLLAAGACCFCMGLGKARAAEQEREEREPPSDTTRALAAGASAFPGVLVHGSGSYVLGRTETATPLLYTELGGLGLILGSGVTLLQTGAARDLAGIAAVGTVAGFGLFTVSWLADIYAVTAPEGGWGQAAGTTPVWEAELGYRYIYDPLFDYRHFGVNRISFWPGRWRLSPSLWAAPADGNSRWRMEIAYRFLGSSRARRSQDGSFLEMQVAGTEHRFPRDRFGLTTAEWMVSGRLDLEHLGPHLDGSFAELGFGTGYQATRFAVTGIDTMGASLLLSRFAFGIYIGDQYSGGGEWSLYYDHRHDGFAAGLQIPGAGGGGGVGHLGMVGHHYLDEHWGLGFDAQVGSAYVLGVSARFRHWGAP